MVDRAVVVEQHEERVGGITGTIIIGRMSALTAAPPRPFVEKQQRQAERDQKLNCHAGRDDEEVPHDC